MRTLHLLLIAICLAVAPSALAQEAIKPQRKLPSWLPKPPARPLRAARPAPAEKKLSIRQAYKPVGKANVLTFNAPAFMMIQEHIIGGGGMEYERFLDNEGRFSTSLAAYAAGTFISYKGAYTYMSAFYAVPSILYHPLGNRQLVDVSGGFGLAQGWMRREQDDETGVAPPAILEKNSMTALLGQVNVSLHHVKAFVFGANFSAGALLHPTHRERLLLQGSLKFGFRF